MLTNFYFYEPNESLRSRSNGSFNKMNARSSSDISNKFDSNSEDGLESDYAVEVEVRSASSHYSFDEWIEGTVTLKF